MVAAFAPGRMNLIGEHTDYNGGLALPFAIERGVTVTAEPADGAHVEVVAVDLGERDRFAVADPGAGERSGWRTFARGVVAELMAAGVDVGAARLEISADVPRGSGLSSSAALEVALALALSALAGEAAPDRVGLAALCSRVESDWFGARSGLLDQLASLLGEEDVVLRIDFLTLQVERVPLRLDGWRLACRDSGERHDLAAGGYNERRAECAEAARLLGVASLRDAPQDAATSLPPTLERRLRHVVEENRRVEEVTAALRAGEPERLGPLLTASHRSLRDLYDASTPAVERAVAAMLEAGAAGARMVGGGFGGQVLALFPPGVAPPPGTLEVAPSAGARLL